MSLVQRLRVPLLQIYPTITCRSSSRSSSGLSSPWSKHRFLERLELHNYRSGCSQTKSNCASAIICNITPNGFRTIASLTSNSTKKSLSLRFPGCHLFQRQGYSLFSFQRESIILLKKSETEFQSHSQFAYFHKKSKKSQALMRDKLVYSHDNEKFYRMFAFFGVFQMIIWLYLAEMCQHFRTAPKGNVDVTDMPWWKRMIYKEGQFKNSLSALSVAVGLIVLYISVTYPRRAIRELWLLSGGQNVRLETYSLFKSQKTVVTPVETLDCQGSRTGVGGFIPIKVKGNTFFFILDKRGEFHERDLFDFKIGLKRDIK